MECSCYTKSDIRKIVSKGHYAESLDSSLKHLNNNILPDWVCNKCGGTDWWIRHYMQQLFDNKNNLLEKE